MLRIAHLTSVHPRDDVRIFDKMCRGLARRGFDIQLVVADGLGSDVLDGVDITDAGRESGRAKRILSTPGRVLRAALGLHADVYHLHDPELLPIGLRLRKSGSIVIFDSHEDFPKHVRAKHYMPEIAKRPAEALCSAVESFFCPRLSGIVAPTPGITAKFDRMGCRTALVRNFPRPDDYVVPKPLPGGPPRVCYVGAISEHRGIHEMMASLGLTRSDTRLSLAGSLSPASLLQQLRTDPLWSRVDFLGRIDRTGIHDVYARCIAGLVCLRPLQNYVDAYPIKLFEYMAAGLPVIASDFPEWRRIINGSQCGVLVDPRSPVEIASAIDGLVQDPVRASELGRNGRCAVEMRYSWAAEEQRLVDFYVALHRAN